VPTAVADDVICLAISALSVIDFLKMVLLVAKFDD